VLVFCIVLPLDLAKNLDYNFPMKKEVPFLVTLLAVQPVVETVKSMVKLKTKKSDIDVLNVKKLLLVKSFCLRPGKTL
jgi:hypothetical protein